MATVEILITKLVPRVRQRIAELSTENQYSVELMELQTLLSFCETIIAWKHSEFVTLSHDEYLKLF